MPNHVHLLFTLSPEESFKEVIHSIKSFTAHEINKALNRSGAIWQQESYDRMIRDFDHF